MIEQEIVATNETPRQGRERQLQRRVLRLLLQHGEPLFRRQFHLFFAESTLPPIPLLQQYDRFMKLRTLGGELLNDILPRVRRQLSLKTSHDRLREEAPTRGEIDWPRTLERNTSQQPGLPPLQFETRLRQRTMNTPENVLVVAILLAYRQELQRALAEQFEDESFSAHERQALVSADEQAERELAAAYARALMKQALQIDIDELAQQVAAHLRPGPSPYRALLFWWQRFNSFHVGRASGKYTIALVSRRDNEKTTAWLYELWIALELLHLLHQEEAIQAQDIHIATDILQYTFSWGKRRFRLLYNRQIDTSTSFEPDWEYGPATRPDYTIEREEPLEIRHVGQLIWREPPVVLDAKYYLEGSDPTNTHGPVKKLLGDMTLLDAQVGALFFPQLPEPEGAQQITRTIRRTGKQYASGETRQVHLLRLEPQMPLADLQTRLRAILDLATEHLPARPMPVCLGMALDSDTINASDKNSSAQMILCPKPHIGHGIFDLVNVETDCLKNPRLCHVMGQPIVPPFVLRVITQEQLEQQSRTLRTRSNELLQDAEQAGDEARAELIRAHIFTGIGRAVEQYVSLFGNTKPIEEKFGGWIFGRYWQQDKRSLAANTRRSLVSGEHIWQNYSATNTLQDWAAPAIQYCRALEFELKRRLYDPCPHDYGYLPGGFTLGTVTYAFKKHDKEESAHKIWQTFTELVKKSHSNPDEFEKITERIYRENIREKRNILADGGIITKETATTLHDVVVGENFDNPGILRWLAERLDPV